MRKAKRRTGQKDKSEHDEQFTQGEAAQFVMGTLQQKKLFEASLRNGRGGRGNLATNS